MKAIYELKEKSSAELVVTITGEKWQQAQKKAFNKIKNDTEIPGFRKGKHQRQELDKLLRTINLVRCN